MHHGIDVGDVTSLAASIAAEGLLQPITVKHFGYADSRFGEPDYELYEVLAGRRRWQAICELVNDGRMSPEELISVNVFDGDEADASLLSAVENLERINLHPVDQYEAFTRLIEQGSSEEKICKTFGISVRELQQRLALGQLSPRVRNAWRNGELKTEAAKLYTLGSIEEQDELLSQYHHIRSEPAAIRRHFPKTEIPGSDPRAQFVGENAYVDAKGRLEKTIFETFFSDEKLLASLVVKKLEKIGEDLAREEGWGIVAVEGRDVDMWSYGDAGKGDFLRMSKRASKKSIRRLMSLTPTMTKRKSSGWKKKPPIFATSGLEHILADPTQLATKENIGAAIDGIKPVIKPGTDAKNVPEEIAEFRKAFDKVLKDAGIKQLIVLVDDLDRCLPDTAIETLEAIRLFVFTSGTAFVVAADEAMIEYAVRKHFPELPAIIWKSSSRFLFVYHRLAKLKHASK